MADADSVAKATGLNAVKLSRYWALIVQALEAEGINTPNVQTAVAATVATEVPNFAPVAEYGAREYFNKYEPGTSIGARLGNTMPGDGYKYRGRGFIQLTGRANYRGYGTRLNLPLEENPDLALDAYQAARILAAYFKDRGVAAAAERHDWEKVRKLVNGGLNGWDRFIGVVNNLTASVAPLTERGTTNPIFLGVMALVLVGLLAVRKWA